MVDRMRSYSLCKDRAKAPVEMFAAYEAVTLLAKVAHDIVQSSREKKVRPTLIGTAFVREFSNRTYNLSTVSASFDTSACKIPNFLIKLFNSTTQTFENVIFFQGKDRTTSLPFGRNVTWPGGRLPDNEPRCGFGGLNVECRKSSTETLLVSSVSVVATLSAILAGALFYIRWAEKKSAVHHVRGMLLSLDELVFGSRYTYG
ncbi:hypothetical protein RvY_16928 [Ramazzottius varieornatus]|uniref:Receptor ligand binding region domain-containing protein n=1 Tax=Ramazzottius varieornatus TaxID=947166 RepID=A0A1D1W0A2_RAMVA|nr:hypothetical protein RvY_16928 [Ramazzottius varieornatus]